MSDDAGEQRTLDGEKIESKANEPGLNDFGDEMPWYETKGGYRRDLVSSLLQKSIRRSDEEKAAWAAWELVRSGAASHFWKRMRLIVIEDLMAGHEVALLVHRYDQMARECWEIDSWEGKLCAIGAALTAARAPSSREMTYANDLFDKLAQDRVRAEQEEDHEILYDPIVTEDDFESGGELDVCADKHTYPGSARGRGWRHFRVHGSRCGPNEDSIVGAKWRRRAMKYDTYGYREPEIDFTDEEINHSCTPTDPDAPWDEDRTNSTKDLDQFE